MQRNDALAIVFHMAMLVFTCSVRSESNQKIEKNIEIETIHDVKERGICFDIKESCP